MCDTQTLHGASDRRELKHRNAFGENFISKSATVERLMKISVRDGIISPEFLAAGRKFYSGTATPKETETWIGFKGKLYDAVVNSKIEDILRTEIVD